jgi:ribosomal protection tetracycline resistance protein
MFSGTVRTRDRLRFGADCEGGAGRQGGGGRQGAGRQGGGGRKGGGGREGTVTALAVFDRGPAAPRLSVTAGEIAKLWGLAEIQIGDRIGEPDARELTRQFPPPTMESVVVARDPADRGRMRVALGQIAEQDPLINLHQDDERQEISVSLYGEVQKEVIQATLANDYDVQVTFKQTTIIYVERPAGAGSALEVLQSDDHPYSATIGLTIEPAAPGSGIHFRLEVDPRSLPLFVYKNVGSFSEAMTSYVRDALRTGRCGWQVTDCEVTMTRCGYYVGDGPAKPTLSTPKTTAADFRKLTPVVLGQALAKAGTVVCEPMVSARLEIPAGRTGPVLAAVARLGAAVDAPQSRGELSVLETVLPAASVHQLQQQLPGLTGGEGVLESSFAGYQPVHGVPPVRRSDASERRR